MGLELAEQTAERDVFFSADVLIAKHENFVIEPSLAQRGQRGRVDVCKVDARDLGTQGSRQRFDSNSHFVARSSLDFRWAGKCKY